MLQEYYYEIIASIIFFTLIIIYFLTRKFDQEEQNTQEYVKQKQSKQLDSINLEEDTQEEPQSSSTLYEDEIDEEPYRMDTQEEGSFGTIDQDPFDTNSQTINNATQNNLRKKCIVPKHGKIKKENFKDFKGVKILVAEDNLINQKVISGLLQGSGIELTIADDGQIALDILKENSDFNLILMDVHMPRVDGFAATKMIRSNPEYEHIVIVALSGDIAVDDIRKMTEAGMEEHLAKPLRMEAFYDILYAYTKANSSLSPTPIEVILTQELDGDKGLEICGGDEEFYKDILNEFILTYTDVSKKLLTFLHDGDIKLADALLLDFVGITANIGANNIRLIALDLKELLGDSEEKSYLTILDNFEVHLESLLRDIRNYLT